MATEPPKTDNAWFAIVEIAVSTTLLVNEEDVVVGSIALIVIACRAMLPNAYIISFPNPALELHVLPTFEECESWSTYPSTPTPGVRLTTVPDIVPIGYIC